MSGETRRGLPVRMTLSLTLLAAVGCGTSASRPPVSAAQLCRLAAQAAGQQLRAPVSRRLTSSDAADTECLLSGAGIHLDLVAQAVPQAQGDYDTAIVHYVQVYSEPGGIRDRSQLPHNISGLGTEAAWVPGPHRLLATNGSRERGGNFLSVTVTPLTEPQALSLAVAQAVAEATLPLAPRGPDVRSDV
jgi:hypothetical protein